MKHLTATFIGILMSVTAVGAQTSTPAPGPGPETTTLEIKNSAEIAIVFDISCDQGSNWDAMTLAAECAAPAADLAGAVGATLQSVTKLRGEVRLVAPGSLPNDGKVIADERGAS